MDKATMAKIAEMILEGKTVKDLGPIKPLTLQERLDRMTDTQVRYIFQQDLWEQGTAEARAACLAEYDKRIGLENWPKHIQK